MQCIRALRDQFDIGPTLVQCLCTNVGWTTLVQYWNDANASTMINIILVQCWSNVFLPTAVCSQPYNHKPTLGQRKLAIWVGPSQELNPRPRGYEIPTFSRGLQGHYNHTFSFFLTCVGVEKKIFEYLAFLHNLTHLCPLEEVETWISQFRFHLPYTCFILKLVTIGQVVFKKMLKM